MGVYDQYVLPRMLDLFMGTKPFEDARRRCLSEARGDVLELGFGTGRNLAHYPAGVTRVVGVDPSGESGKIARKRIARAAFPVEFVALPGERIAAPDHSFDSAVSTFSLCTIPDPAAALAQVRRVLKPGGRFFFFEHGLSDEPRVQRWQQRLNPMQRWMCGGCNLNRDIQRLVSDAGFSLETLERGYEPGPRPLAYCYRGVARA